MSTEEAQRHLHDLIEDRKILAVEISQLRQQMESGNKPVTKIRVSTVCTACLCGIFVRLFPSLPQEVPEFS